ncbi:MAG: hypothetical protein ACO3ZW_08880 [Opitutales bacterium]|jgi:hypothetical protein
MKNAFDWLERLSLDAVLVAMAWGLALGGRMMDLLVLGIATWLAYVADRLWEVRPAKDVPQTDRHLYYLNHYRKFGLAWVMGLGASTTLALLFLPLWKVLGGCALVALISLYLYLLGRPMGFSGKLALKRSVVPLVFAAGVVWMSESWRSTDGIAGSMVLLSAAFANLLLISCRENRDQFLPAWLPRATGASLLGMLLVANAALLVHWPVGVAGLLCCMGYFVLMVRIRAADVVHARAWADGCLLVSGLLLFWVS